MQSNYLKEIVRIQSPSSSGQNVVSSKRPFKARFIPVPEPVVSSYGSGRSERKRRQPVFETIMEDEDQTAIVERPQEERPHPIFKLFRQPPRQPEVVETQVRTSTHNIFEGINGHQKKSDSMENNVRLEDSKQSLVMSSGASGTSLTARIIGPLGHIRISETDIARFLSTVYRASFDPTIERILKSRSSRDKPHEPMPQFEQISALMMYAQEIFGFKGHLLSRAALPACELTIVRIPILCPDVCQKLSFVSDYNMHLVRDHVTMPAYIIKPNAYKTIQIDIQQCQLGVARSEAVFLLRNKITNLGTSDYKDCLPVLVMSQHVHVTDLFQLDPSTLDVDTDNSYLLIWLNALVPAEFPIWSTMAVWSRVHNNPICCKVVSGEVYNIRDSQNPRDLYDSGRLLMLSTLDLDQLTHAGHQKLQLQIMLH